MTLVVEPSGGMKADGEKQSLTYIPPEWWQWWRKKGCQLQPMMSLDRIMQYGAEKYEPDNWRLVSYHRYILAAARHAEPWHERDPDTGELHKHHVLCNLGFVAVVSGFKLSQYDERVTTYDAVPELVISLRSGSAAYEVAGVAGSAFINGCRA